MITNMLNSIADIKGFIKTFSASRTGFWYLASPYSGHPGGYDKAYEEIAEITAKLMKHSLHIFSPINHCHPIAHKYNLGRDHFYWMDYDVRMVRGAVGILVAQMNGWEKSTGVTAEITAAMLGEKPIGMISPVAIKEICNDAK